MAAFSSYPIAVSIGVFVHHVIFRHGEWHTRGAQILFSHIAALLVLEFRPYVASESWHFLPRASPTFFGSYLLGLFGSITGYRLFFHPLKKFPGPLLAKFSKLWHVYQNMDSRNHKTLGTLHQKYGNVFRVGPNELVIVDPIAHMVIDGPNNTCSKADWYDVVQPNTSVLFTRNQSMHDQRRRIWLKVLSAKAVSSYQPRLEKHLDAFDKLIYEASQSGSVVNINDLMKRLTFDTMGEFAFAKDFRSLTLDVIAQKSGGADHASCHYAMDIMRRANELLGPINPATWIIHLGNTLFPFLPAVRDFQHFLYFCQQQIRDRLEMDERIKDPDIASCLIAEAKKNGFKEKDKQWLDGDSIAVVVAGSETIASTLAFLLYCLVTHPEDAEKIYKEVVDLDIHNMAKLSSLPHLNGCISESQRLWPANPTFHPRRTGPEGLKIGEAFIPANCNVSVPRYLLGRLDTCYQDATSFIPERWYKYPEMVKNRSAFVPFSVGERSCSGKLLALAMVRSVAARILQKYYIEVPAGIDVHRTVNEMKDYGTVSPGLLELQFVPRC